MAKNSNKAAVGVGLFGAMVTALAMGGSRARPQAPSRDAAQRARERVRVNVVWGEFLQACVAPSDQELVAWDGMMETGHLPPGYFFAIDGTVVPPNQVLEHYTVMQEHSWDEAVQLSTEMHNLQIANCPQFYIRRGRVRIQDGMVRIVDFPRPVQVRLLPATYADLTMTSGAAGALEYLSPTWRVEALPGELQDVDTRDWDLSHWSMEFDPINILLGADNDPDTHEYF